MHSALQLRRRCRRSGQALQLPIAAAVLTDSLPYLRRRRLSLRLRQTVISGQYYRLLTKFCVVNDRVSCLFPSPLCIVLAQFIVNETRLSVSLLLPLPSLPLSLRQENNLFVNLSSRITTPLFFSSPSLISKRR